MEASRRLITVIVLIAAMLVAGSSAYANVRVEDAGNVPFYARDLPGDEWTAIIFYRPPSCVPDDFDLWAFFDIPGAFACGPVTTDGFAVWKNESEDEIAPIHHVLEEIDAVPIYFVRTAEYNAAAADGVLTMAEVEAMPSLILGTATVYHEVLHPQEGAKVGKLTVVASGTLEDGRAFRLQVVGVNNNYHVRIRFE